MPEWDEAGKFLPESVGTVINREVLDANIATSATIAAGRTAEQGNESWVIDRRNQNYSAVNGLGPWAAEFRAGTNTGTTIPSDAPADATMVRYDDGGNANGRWADEDSEYGAMVALVDKIRASSASTNPSKAYFSYARPFRWSDDGPVLPELLPVKKADTEALSDGGFPSGHTNAGWLASYALAYSAPERYQEILTNASEIGNSRIVAGMHSAMDVVGGRIMSTAVAAAALNQPENEQLLSDARDAGRALMATPASGDDRWADRADNEELYVERLTYGLPRVGDTTLPVVVPKGAEALLASRLPYLTDEQRRWVLQSTGLESGYALLDDAEGWGRLNLYAAADGYSAFDVDVTVGMDAAQGGFSAQDAWRNDIDGVGALTKDGTGVLTLTGDNSYSGGTTVAGGQLVAASATALGAGSVATRVGGALIDASDATVTVAGDLTLAAGGTLALTIDDVNPALAVAGAGSFDGALEVTIADGVVPADDAVIATFAGLGAGEGFSKVTVNGAPDGYDPVIEIRDSAVHLVNDAAEPEQFVPGQPSVSGAAVAGTVLTVDPGAWSPEPVEFSYLWNRDGEVIEGATLANYTPNYLDVGHAIGVTVTAHKAGFASASATVTVRRHCCCRRQPEQEHRDRGR
ncbi:acid phosphatase [Microbacterium sp. CH12i]|uniref:acid phosphatase n=1 Tax=Microbacterium sp. CH12i TaxID=1479651 RepID=UPI00068D84ED|nr:phosphatase PAP2 family protein [Microbacterium sp. CH12i]